MRCLLSMAECPILTVLLYKLCMSELVQGSWQCMYSQNCTACHHDAALWNAHQQVAIHPGVQHAIHVVCVLQAPGVHFGVQPCTCCVL